MKQNARLAHLDRASPSGGEGGTFESCISQMPFKLSLTLSFLVSMAAPAAFLLLDKDTGVMSNDAYATLVLDGTQDEREFCALLFRHKIKNYLSASNQQAFLNDFDELLQLPLDEYFSKIEDYDPRNDGYAGRALAIFQNNGEKRIFIPAGDLNGIMADPRIEIVNALEGKPYKALYIGSLPEQYTLNKVIFVLACVLLAGFASDTTPNASGLRTRSPLKRTSFPGRPVVPIGRIFRISHLKIFYVLALIPDFAIMIKSGAAGFAICAFVLVFPETLRKPLLRFLENIQLNGIQYKLKPQQFAAGNLKYLLRIDKNKILIHDLVQELFFISPLVLIFIAVCVAGRLNLFKVLCFLFFFFLAFFSMLFCELQIIKKTEHSPFLRVPVFSKKNSNVPAKYPSLPLPFLLAAAAGFAVTFFPGAIKSGAPPPDFIPPVSPVNPALDKNDYRKHYEFQKNFSYFNINKDEQQPYICYALGKDGLIKPSNESPEKEEAPEMPPFPLAKLLRFLNAPDNMALEIASSGTPRFNSLFVLFFAFSLYLPFAFYNYKQTRHRAAGFSLLS